MSAGFDPGGFTNVDGARSPAEFSASLDRAGAISTIVENRRLVREALAVSPGDAVLDVGSGNGEEAHAIARLVGPAGRVVGVDRSVVLVDEARRRTPAGMPNLEFIVADGHALPFRDAEFDAVRAERVLQHVDDPAQVAREMVRVTRPGGRVAAWEPDWSLLFLSSTDQETSAAVADRVAAAVRHPRIGRGLATLFARAGLSDISMTARIGLWETFDAVEERIGPAAIIGKLVAEGELSPARGERWLAELREDAAAGTLAAGVCGFVVSGRRA